MNTYILECPNCKKEMQKNGEYRDEVQCPDCGDRFKITDLTIVREVANKKPVNMAQNGITTKRSFTATLLTIVWILCLLGVAFYALSFNFQLCAIFLAIGLVFLAFAKIIKVLIEIKVSIVNNLLKIK